MLPTLSGRIQTRILLLLIIGGIWTLIITPALQRRQVHWWGSLMAALSKSLACPSRAALAMRPVPGSGLLQRRDDVVVLIAADGAPAMVDTILDLSRSESDGRRLARRLALLL